MKTKIIYISGNEVFDMHDIRAAFDEVRCALNLDKNTVLFGVPVDTDDACLMKTDETKENVVEQPIIEQEIEPIQETSQENEFQETQQENIIETPIVNESVVELKEETPAPKKRGRPRKEEVIQEVIEETPIEDEIDEQPVESENVEIPILSVLSAKEETITESVEESDIHEEVDIIPEISDEKAEEQTTTEISEPITDSEEEPDLEKLLSAMTPLQEDVSIEVPNDEVIEENESDDISVDATLEQLANEFAETQDKRQSETKTQSRSKIGKLRNILPFKQSKHKDQGIGDLLEWAGIAANDEDFSVPGFFTNVASKK